MMTNCLLDHSGQPIYIQGYAGVFGVPRSDSWPELVRPWAFDHVLKNASAALNCQFHHGGLKYIAGSLALNTLWLWTDEFGLAFSAGPFNVCGRNLALLNSIACGEVRGASWSGKFGSARREIIDGVRVNVIRRFKTLDHISPVSEPAYPETGVWLSSEHPDRMPPRLKALAGFWSAHRPRHDTAKALRKMARGVSALPRRAAAPRAATSQPQARPTARRHPPVMLALSDFYPAIPGLSSEELQDAALQEAHARKGHKEAESKKFARQREQNRARRKTKCLA